MVELPKERQVIAMRETSGSLVDDQHLARAGQPNGFRDCQHSTSLQIGRCHKDESWSGLFAGLPHVAGRTRAEWGKQRFSSHPQLYDSLREVETRRDRGAQLASEIRRVALCVPQCPGKG